MIIDKKRIIAAILALVLVALALVSCADDGNALDDLEKMSDRFSRDSDQDTEGVPISYIGLIVPDDCSAQLALVARQLAQDISARLGVDCKMSYDEDDVVKRDGYAEISLGKTNRDAALIATEGLRDKDYVCVSIDGHTVIGGVSDAATLVAIECFKNDILPYAVKDELISEERAIRYSGEYQLDQILLCGFDISDCVLLCASEDAREFAVLLRDSISEKYGARLDIVTGSTRVDGRKEISLGIDTQSSGAYMLKQGEDILAIADSSYGLSYLIARLHEMLLDDNDGHVSCDMSETVFADCGGNGISVMTILSSLDTERDDLANTTSLAEFINDSENDVIFIGSMPWDTWGFIKYNISDTYAVLELSADNKDVYPVIYRKASVKLVGGGVESASGVSIQKLAFERLADATTYSFNVMASSVSGDYCEEILNSLSSDVTAVTVVTASAGKMAVKGDNVSVILSANVNVYDTGFYHGIFYRNNTTVARDAYQRVFDAYTSYVTFNVGVRYCADYLALLSQNSR